MIRYTFLYFTPMLLLSSFLNAKENCSFELPKPALVYTNNHSVMTAEQFQRDSCFGFENRDRTQLILCYDGLVKKKAEFYSSKQIEKLLDDQHKCFAQQLASMETRIIEKLRREATNYN